MENNGTDRISQLPEHFIHRILFFLPAKDAARSSILSKTWLHVWESLPIVTVGSDVFRRKPLQSKGFPFPFADVDNPSAVIDKYLDLIDKSLEKLHDHKVLIERFQLHLVDIIEEHASRIDHFIKLATKNYIKQLALHGVFSNQIGLRPPLPLATFASNSFSVLHLKECVLPPELLGDNPRFPCLRELSLDRVKNADQIVQTLLINCPLLETFSIKSLAVKHVQLRDLPHLKRVTIVGVRVVVIEAINIQTLYYRYRNNNPLDLHLVSCDNLKELFLISHFTVEYIHELVANQPRLETLVLEPYVALEGLKISSQQLRHLTLYVMPRVGPMKVEIDTPNLRFYNSHIFAAEDAPSLVLINASRPLEAILHVWFHPRVGDNLSAGQFFIGLNLQLFKYNVLMIYVYSDVQNESILAHLRQNSEGPPANLKLLLLGCVRSSFDFAAFLDCFFWICRPKTISIKPIRGSNIEFIEFSRDKLISRKENPQCCSNMKCWRHYLKEMKIRKIGRMNEENVERGHDIALNGSSQSAERCKEVIIDLKWTKLGQNGKNKKARVSDQN